MTTFEIVKKLAESRKITIAELERKLDFGTNSLYAWKNHTPKVERLEQVANYFGVSVDYLLGRDVPEWADNDDVYDLKRFLEEDGKMSFGGENLTEEEEQRVKDILTTLFWEKLKKRKGSN